MTHTKHRWVIVVGDSSAPVLVCKDCDKSRALTNSEPVHPASQEDQQG